jgi:hypothetical protein
MIVILHRDYLACPPYVILASVDYSILLLCLSLATLNRFLAIARYECYKKNVTNHGVIVLFSITSSLSFVIIIQSVLDWLLVRLHLLHQFGSHALGPGLEFVAGTRLPRFLIEDFHGIQNSDAPVQDKSPPLRVTHGEIPQHIQQKQRQFRYIIIIDCFASFKLCCKCKTAASPPLSVINNR